MSVTLGEAILKLRSDDSQLRGGVRKAEGVAQRFVKGMGGMVTSAISTAAGFILSNVLQGLVRGIGSLAKEALDEIASYERLTMSLESLTARELVRQSVVTETSQIVREATLNEMALRERLIASIAEQEDKVRKLGKSQGQNSIEYKKAVGDLTNMQNQFEALGISEDGYVTRTIESSNATMSLEEAMGQAGPKAKELVRWVEMLAIKSPFDQEGVAQTFRQALAYGFTTEEAKRLTEATLDFAAGTGATTESMGRLSLALGQMRAKGKLTGEEIRQMTEAGLPVLEMMATAYGKTTAEISDMVSKGLVPADKAFDALVGTMEAEFGGAAAKQSETWAGLLNTFEDLKAMGLRELFTGMAQALQPLIAGLADWLQTEGLDKLAEWGSAAGEALGKLVENAEILWGALQWLITGEPNGKLAQLIVSEGKFKGLIQLKDMLDEIKAAFDGGGFAGVADLLADMGVPAWVVTSLESLQGAFNNLGEFFTSEAFERIKTSGIERFQALAETLGGLAQDIIPWLAQQFEKISAWFVTNGPLIASVQEKATETFQLWMQKLLELWPVVQPILQAIIDGFLGLVETILNVVNGDWPAAWDSLKETVINIFMLLEDAWVEFVDWILSFLDTSWEQVTDVWKENWEMFIAIWEIVKNKLAAKFEGWIAWIKNFGVDFIQGLADGISERASAVVEAVKAALGEALDLIKQLANIGSPSRVTMEDGRNIAKGLAVGIIDSAGMVRDAIAQLMRPISDGLTINAAALAGAGAGGGNKEQNFYVNGQTDERMLADYLLTLESYHG